MAIPKRIILGLIIGVSAAGCVPGNRVAGLPTPPAVYQKVGAVDDFAFGPTRLREDVWIVKSTDFIDAVQSNPRCPLRMDGNRLVDCRAQVYAVAGDSANHLAGPETPEGLNKLCTWVYPPQGDVYVYFGNAHGGCPR